NFKHHRLKGQLKSVGVNKIFHHSINNEPYRDLTFKDDVSRTLDIRQKRSVGVSLKHTVETLVVADAKMYEYHGEDVENYVLTLMSIVKTIYQSPSIRNFIDVVVVKLIIYEKASETPFKVNQSAAATLKNFCQWQHKNKEMNTDHQYDTAILLTREDICRAPGKCDTLGLAELGTICDKLRSCSLIEDNGISAAFTIAHELGHVFNLPHDDDKQCSELLPHDQKLAFHVMAPTLDYNASPWDWSNCSAKLMTEFLESGLATCLHDGSRVKTWMNSMQALSEPGWTYSVNKQCKFVFGEDFVICPYSMTMVGAMT
ncbi:Mitochondrial Rho GTPase 1, partial [Bulinus truncatus]